MISRTQRPSRWMLLTMLVAASPAHAVRIAEFGVACYDGGARVSFIELSGNALERFDHTIGIRTLDRSGTVLWEAPDIYAGLNFAIYWVPDPPRHIGIVTPETRDLLGMPMTPDLLMGAPMDTLAGSIVLFRGAAVLERIDYGEGRAVQAPPPGTSMLRGPTAWASPFTSPMAIECGPAPGDASALFRNVPSPWPRSTAK